MLANYDARALAKLFAGLTEYTFISELGLTDTQLVDYLSEMLTRFIHRDTIYAIKDASQRRLEEVAEMMVEAERPEHRGEKRREIFRHIGDFSLFWTGVYPEAINTRRNCFRKDSLISYFEQGKKSYFIASTYSDTQEHAEQAPVLRRLSDQFELCAHGLRLVRAHWEESQPPDA
ncbi:MAG: hypothetical protein U1D30_16610 [Planctomycetota bacterium]